MGFAAFCCSDVEADPAACPFCDGMAIDEEKPFDFSEHINTCGKAKELAKYIVQDFICDTVLSAGVQSCCDGSEPEKTDAPTISSPPPPAPTPFPTPNPTPGPIATQAPIVPQDLTPKSSAHGVTAGTFSFSAILL